MSEEIWNEANADNEDDDILNRILEAEANEIWLEEVDEDEDSDFPTNQMKSSFQEN